MKKAHKQVRKYFQKYVASEKGGKQFLKEQAKYQKGRIIPSELRFNPPTDSGFFFGLAKKPRGCVGKPDHMDGHILVTGGPGTGKTRGIVIPTMQTWCGSQVILDVKTNLHHHRSPQSLRTGKRVLRFGPGVDARDSCRFDPFALLRREGAEKLVANAGDLAQALVPRSPTVHDPVWIEATQTFLTGALLYYYEQGYPFVRTMTEIQTHPLPSILDEILHKGSTKAKSFIVKLCEVQEKVLCNIGLELSHLAFLVTDSWAVEALTPDEERPLLDWSYLNTSPEPVDVLLQIPEADLDRWKPLVLLMVNQLTKSLERRPEYVYGRRFGLPPVLVVLDEFPRIGPVAPIVSGLATLRSRGVTFALFIQSLSDLDRLYGGATARAIADLCAYKAVLGVADVASQRYFADLIGTVAAVQTNISVQVNPKNGKIVGFSGSGSEGQRPILQPHELLQLEDVVLITPFGYCRVEKFVPAEPRQLACKEYAPDSCVAFSGVLGGA